MLVNLSDVLTSEGKQISMEVPLEAERFYNGYEEFEILEKSHVSISAEYIEQNKARVRARFQVKFRTYCDRCLKKLTTSLDLDSERIAAPTDVMQEDEEIDDLSFMDGYQLDVETFVYNEIIGNWPAKILCKDNCKGLCPVCGQNLNDKECGCDTFVPDPRMAMIQDIFNANKEV